MASQPPILAICLLMGVIGVLLVLFGPTCRGSLLGRKRGKTLIAMFIYAVPLDNHLLVSLACPVILIVTVLLPLPVSSLPVSE